MMSGNSEDTHERAKKIEIRSTSITDEYDVDWDQKLGTGISGPVRLATKRSTGEKFAIKVVVDRPKAVQEVQMHWRCSGHPHVVSIYEVFRNSLQFPGESESLSRLLLVLELMDGGELFYRISKQNGFTERQAAATTMQIALAVQHLHSFNIAHRDLKPENLLYQTKLENSPIKLCDFGFAKQDKGDMTTPQFTPYYVSPQVLEAQRRHRKERSSATSVQPYTYDKSCDMWSLGVIIYILMCGYPPFYSEHPTSRRAIDRSMRRKIMSGTYMLNDREWGRVSLQAKDVVKRLLSVDPEERMNIDDLVNHPWLTEEAPDTLLQSPLYISNKEHMKETGSLYKSHMKKMRIIVRSANLKPIESAINPMLVKRQQLSRQGEGNKIMSDDGVVVEANHKLLKPLRDMIAMCLFVNCDNGDDFCRKLADLVTISLKETQDNELLKEVLEEYSWNGSLFEQKVDVKAFAYSMKDVIETIKHSRDYN